MSELERVKAGIVLRGHLTLEQVRDGLLDDEVLQCLYLSVPALVARVEKAEGYNDWWREEMAKAVTVHSDMLTERDTLKAEVERLKKDNALLRIFANVDGTLDLLESLQKRVEELEGLLKAERLHSQDRRPF